MNRGKIWKLTLIFLLVGNIVLTGWILFSMKNRHHPPMTKEDSKAMLIQELQLNKEQAAKYTTMAEQHFSDMERLHHQRNECMRSLLLLTKTNPLDSAKFQLLIQQSAALEIKMDSTMFDHFRTIYLMCDKNQAEHFDKVINGAIAPPQDNPPPHEKDK